MGAFIDRFLTKTAASVVLSKVVIILLGVTQKLADNITLKEAPPLYHQTSAYDRHGHAHYGSEVACNQILGRPDGKISVKKSQ